MYVQVRKLESHHAVSWFPLTDHDLLHILLEKLAFSFVLGNKEKQKQVDTSNPKLLWSWEVGTTDLELEFS